MERKVRVYVVSLVGSNEELNLMPWETDRLLRRVGELQKGQILTVHVASKSQTEIAAMEEFEGW